VALPRVFVSFDLDHDNDLKQRLADMSVDGRSGVDVYDWSIRETAADWRDKLCKRIANVDSVVVLCGGFTDRSANVAAELEIACAAERPYFLLDGRPPTTRKPAGAASADRLLAWTQANLLAIGGGRVPAPITAEFDDLRPESRSRLRLRRR
jgi:antiphage defense system Thoeris ThsB-like protein